MVKGKQINEVKIHLVQFYINIYLVFDIIKGKTNVLQGSAKLVPNKISPQKITEISLQNIVRKTTTMILN